MTQATKIGTAMTGLSVREQCEQAFTTGFGTCDVMMVSTGNLPNARQQFLTWAHHRLNMGLDCSLCTGSPVALIDLRFMEAGFAELNTGKAILEIDAADQYFSDRLIEYANYANTIILVGLDEGLTYPRGQDIRALVERLAKVFTLTVLETAGDLVPTLAAQFVQSKLRLTSLQLDVAAAQTRNGDSYRLMLNAIEKMKNPGSAQ